jgi:hypothetical protein
MSASSNGKRPTMNFMFKTVFLFWKEKRKVCLWLSSLSLGQGGKFEFLAEFEWALACRRQAYATWLRFYAEVRIEFKKRF